MADGDLSHLHILPHIVKLLASWTDRQLTGGRSNVSITDTHRDQVLGGGEVVIFILYYEGTVHSRIPASYQKEHG